MGNQHLSAYAAPPRLSAPLSRVEQVLRYIHAHLDEPLTVESMATLGGWSRWQFQRVFQAHTGVSVAQYVRELRLSRGARLLLDTDQRQLDIALDCGFCSEISFSRSFSQMFGCSPGSYRARGFLTGLRTPLPTGELPPPPAELDRCLLQIRLEFRPAFRVMGLSACVHGLFAECPDFMIRVPPLWEALGKVAGQPRGKAVGVLGVANSTDQGASFPYWAAVETTRARPAPGMALLEIPAQTYAVIPFQGPLAALEKTLRWFIDNWLPSSGYRGRCGFDLEVYPPDFNARSAHAHMEYWVPIEPDSLDRTKQ